MSVTKFDDGVSVKTLIRRRRNEKVPLLVTDAMNCEAGRDDAVSRAGVVELTELNWQ